MHNFLVEDLPRKHLRLVHDDLAVLRVGVVAEIRAFVDEALAVRVDHDAERIAVLLEVVADCEIAEGRRVLIPAHCVAARPVTVGQGAGLQRRNDAHTGVVTRAADFCEVPVRSEVARAHFSVRFEAAAREHDRFRADFDGAPLALRAHAFDALIVDDEADCGRLVMNRNAFALARFVFEFDQARAAAPGFAGEAAPELELAVDLESLASVRRLEFHALLAHPHHRFEAAADEDFAQVRIGAVVGDAAHVVEVLVFGIRAVVADLAFFVGDVVQLSEIVRTVEHDAHGAGGVAAVAAAVVDRCRFEDDHLGAGFARRERRTACCIACANYDYVRIAKINSAHRFPRSDFRK